MDVDRPTTLWRNPDFVKLWTGQTVSWIGSAISRLAVPLIAATVLNATPAEIGFLTALGTAPSLLVGLFAGVWVDRFRRWSLLVASDIGRGLLLMTIPAAVLLDRLSMTHVYLVGFLSGTLALISDIASRSYLPMVIERGSLPLDAR